ncbi:hypothetical protein HYALB_00013661 [Hymenoscyphus albidus]|uniref:RING-type domain-containing protein n=1 Tax=Hymenoscyphus albidus TaxID=595503 RepID=A0A9N9M1J1_9HELO|nr:hypothetical protein HYALB_00013661 [Hymenoscyphus albidus]
MEDQIQNTNLYLTTEGENMDPQHQTPAVATSARDTVPNGTSEAEIATQHVGVIKQEKAIASTDDDNECPICCEPIEKKAKVMNCKHEFCHDCIETWLDMSPKSEQGGIATCPNCRGKIVNIAYNFDNEGNFATTFNAAKVWTFSASNLPNNYRHFKHDGKIFSIHDVSQIKIMQTGGKTIFAYLRDLNICSGHVNQNLTSYRDTEADPENTSTFLDVVNNFQKYHSPDGRTVGKVSSARYSTHPISRGVLDERAVFEEGKIKCGVKTWCTLHWEDPDASPHTIAGGTIPAAKPEVFPRSYEPIPPTLRDEHYFKHGV